MATAFDSSTSSAISCPRDSALSSAYVSRCGSCIFCVPGMTCIHPFSKVLGESAIQAVVTLGGFNPQYAPSWCQEMNAGSRANFTNQSDPQTRMLGPMAPSTASSTLG